MENEHPQSVLAPTCYRSWALSQNQRADAAGASGPTWI